MRPGLALRMLAFNSSRPLFRNNPRLRRAVNFALDRHALRRDELRARSSARHRPASAARRCRGSATRTSTRSGGTSHERGSSRAATCATAKAVLYMTEPQPAADPGRAARRTSSSRRSASTSRSSRSPSTSRASNYLEKLTARGAQVGHRARPLDSEHPGRARVPQPPARVAALRRRVADSRSARSSRARRWTGPLAFRRDGRANRAYAEVDAMLARDVAPVAPLNVVHEATLVSDRVGCIVLRPVLDLAVACLKETLVSGACTDTQTRPSIDRDPGGRVADLDRLHDLVRLGIDAGHRSVALRSRPRRRRHRTQRPSARPRPRSAGRAGAQVGRERAPRSRRRAHATQIAPCRRRRSRSVRGRR